MASEAAYLNGEKFRPAVARLLWNCDESTPLLGKQRRLADRLRRALPLQAFDFDVACGRLRR
jgi:hypothetical protein